MQFLITRNSTEEQGHEQDITFINYGNVSLDIFDRKNKRAIFRRHFLSISSLTALPFGRMEAKWCCIPKELNRKAAFWYHHVLQQGRKEPSKRSLCLMTLYIPSLLWLLSFSNETTPLLFSHKFSFILALSKQETDNISGFASIKCGATMEFLSVRHPSRAGDRSHL